MENVRIRLAEENDLPALLPLVKQLGYPSSEADLKTIFKSFLVPEGYGIAVAELMGNIVGCVAWSKGPVFVLPKTRIHIEALVVEEGNRKQGIGRKLMKYVEGIAKQWAPCIIDLTSGLRRANEGTHEFYKSIGYANEGAMAKLYLRKEIKDS